jgi:hypothetical protein
VNGRKGKKKLTLPYWERNWREIIDNQIVTFLRGREKKLILPYGRGARGRFGGYR